MLNAILSLCFQAAAATPAPEPTQRHVEFHYKFTIQDIPQGSQKISVWILAPQDSKVQTIKNLSVTGNVPYQTLSENEYGNQIYWIDLSDKAAAGGSQTIEFVYEAERKAYRALDSQEPAESYSKEKLTRFLTADKLVPIDGKIATEASQVVGKEEDPTAKARRIYDNVVDTLKYDKTGQGWGKGDANYACDIRKGNCTDFHSLFIGESRSQKIPARFLMGFSLPENTSEGKIGGYHCWAEFYVEGKGWIPVDASEASKFPVKKDKLFGGLDAHRLQFTMGRDVTLPQSAAGKVNFFIYPYVEVDGKAHSKIQNEFAFKELK